MQNAVINEFLILYYTKLIILQSGAGCQKMKKKAMDHVLLFVERVHTEQPLHCSITGIKTQ